MESITVVADWEIECPYCNSEFWSILDQPSPDEYLLRCDDCEEKYMVSKMNI